LMLAVVLMCNVDAKAYVSNELYSDIVSSVNMDDKTTISTEDLNTIIKYVHDNYALDAICTSKIENISTTENTLSFSFKHLLSTEYQGDKSIEHYKEDLVTLVGKNLQTAVSPSKSYWKSDICCVATATYDYVQEETATGTILGVILYSTAFSYIKTNVSSPLNVSRVEMLITQYDNTNLFNPQMLTATYYAPISHTIYTLANDNPQAYYVSNITHVVCGSQVFFNDGTSTPSDQYAANALYFPLI